MCHIPSTTAINSALILVWLKAHQFYIWNTNFFVFRLSVSHDFVATLLPVMCSSSSLQCSTLSLTRSPDSQLQPGFTLVYSGNSQAIVRQSLSRSPKSATARRHCFSSASATVLQSVGVSHGSRC